MIFGRRRPVSPWPVSVMSMMMSLCISMLSILFMMVTACKLELNTAVLKTDREEENKEDDGDHKTGASLVIIDQGVRVIAVVGVPAPVEHYHPKGAYHEDKDEQSAINKLSKF